jgi:hypothetical protein
LPDLLGSGPVRDLRRPRAALFSARLAVGGKPELVVRLPADRSEAAVQDSVRVIFHRPTKTGSISVEQVTGNDLCRSE